MLQLMLGHADAAMTLNIYGHLFPDRLDPDSRVDKALLTLIPGETATFTVTSEKLNGTPELANCVMSY